MSEATKCVCVWWLREFILHVYYLYYNLESIQYNSPLKGMCLCVGVCGGGGGEQDPNRRCVGPEPNARGIVFYQPPS